MSSRVLLSAATAVGILLVVVAGLSRVSYDAGGEQVQCPDRVFSSALESLTDRAPDACAAAAQDRIYGVAASLMGLVLISGLLSRRFD